MNGSPVFLALGALTQLLFVYALSTWGRWVARRNGNSSFFRFVSYLPLISMAMIVIGTSIGVMLLMRAFDAINTVDAAHKSSALAASISDAMNASAMFLIPGYALLIFAVVSFAVGTLRQRST